MKKIFIILLFLMIGNVIKGQVAKWLIPPLYDKIKMIHGTDLIITDSVNDKIIWTSNGKRLTKTSDLIFPFTDDHAVTVRRDAYTITGFYNKNGDHISLPDYNIAHLKPYFSDGKLLVMEGDFYRFVDSNGKILEGKYTNAYPFYNGFSSCTTYRNLQKQKDSYNLLLTKDCEEVSFSYNGKLIDSDDIDFISSVNDENIGVVIAKKKVYIFNGKDRSLSPVCAKKEVVNIKNQAKIDNNLSFFLYAETDTTSLLNATCGKDGNVQIRFNTFLLPISIKYIDGDYVYKKRTPIEQNYTSPLQLSVDHQKYGIFWDEKEILPPQFENVLSFVNDKAFVRLFGKYGLLRIHKDEQFKVTINKGNDIAFRHQKFETTLRVDLPKMVSSHNTRINIDPLSGCEVDMTSGQSKDTEFGNYIQYNCMLNIPDSLPDEMYEDNRNEITYPMQIIYDGLISPVQQLKIKAWHYKYFNVDMNDAETTINQGILSFTFDINADRNPDENIYPINVSVQADTLHVELEKISETRYKCRIMPLKEGLNSITIQILEQGCPPTLFPFDVTYIKPTPKTKNKSDVKENVVIKKRTLKKPPMVPKPIPHLDI